MKKKAFLIVILALVLCLTCGMLFVACNEGGDDGGKRFPVQFRADGGRDRGDEC